MEKRIVIPSTDVNRQTADAVLLLDDIDLMRWLYKLQIEQRKERAE